MEKRVNIEKILTKQGKKILLCIYDNDNICSGDMAVCLGIQRNSMSNALERLKNAPMELITVKKSGRRKRYSLTQLGREYVEAVLDQEEVRRELLGKINISQIATGSEDVSELKEQLNECVKELEEEDTRWETHIRDVLRKNKRDKTSELARKFQELLEILLKLKLSPDKKAYTEWLGNLSDENARVYIEEIILRREGLNYFWELVSEDWKKAYEVLDILFGIRWFVAAGKAIQKIEELGIPKAVVKEMAFSFQEIISQAKEDELSKEEFCELLLEEGAEDKEYVYYIAEKYIILTDEK